MHVSLRSTMLRAVCYCCFVGFFKYKSVQIQIPIYGTETSLITIFRAFSLLEKFLINLLYALE